MSPDPNNVLAPCLGPVEIQGCCAGKAPRGRDDNTERVCGSVPMAFLEVTLDLPNLIGDMRKTDDRSAACAGKGVERGRFYFHGERQPSVMARRAGAGKLTLLLA